MRIESGKIEMPELDEGEKKARCKIGAHKKAERSAQKGWPLSLCGV